MKYPNKFTHKHLTLAVLGVSALALTTGCRTSHKESAQYLTTSGASSCSRRE